MDLVPYLERFHEQLLVAAEAGGEDARALAARLTGPLESAARLMLLDALSRAADEITQELSPGSVAVRLRGVDPEFVVANVVDSTPSDADFEPAVPAGSDGDEGGTWRTTLRLPEHLKARVEAAAAREGLSVNSWLVRAVSTALESGTRRRERRSVPGEQTFKGWARS